MCIRYDDSRAGYFVWTKKGERELHPDSPAVKAFLDKQARESLFPGSTGVIIRPGEHGDLTLSTAEWGLMPHWAKDRRFGRKNAYNARAETVAEKPTFREAYKSRRCLVPASCFYERNEVEGRFESWYRFHRPDRHSLMFAGLYELPSRAAEVETYCFVTTEPNLRVLEIHDRMPVLLDAEGQEVWMDLKSDPNDLRAILTPAPEDAISHEFAEPVVVGKRKKKKEDETLF